MTDLISSMWKKWWKRRYYFIIVFESITSLKDEQNFFFSSKILFQSDEITVELKILIDSDTLF